MGTGTLGTRVRAPREGGGGGYSHFELDLEYEHHMGTMRTSKKQRWQLTADRGLTVSIPSIKLQPARTKPNYRMLGRAAAPATAPWHRNVAAMHSAVNIQSNTLHAFGGNVDLFGHGKAVELGCSAGRVRAHILKEQPLSRIEQGQLYRFHDAVKSVTTVTPHAGVQ